MSNAQVAIIGAGPVGLWTAVQAKLQDPSLEIDVLEKHSNYQRSHVVSVSRSSLSGSHSDPRLQALVKEFSEDRNVRTSTMESKLAALAHELGIQILKNSEVKDPRALKEKYPNLKVIVGADGAHSTVRQTVFNNEMSHQGDLKFIIDVKYEVEGEAVPLDFVRSVYPTLKSMGAIAQEYIGRQRDGKTPVTFRLFIDREAFEEMQDATFKHPYSLENEDRINALVMDKIRLWLNLKANKGEKRVKDSEQITATRLGFYASKEVVKEENGVTYCLVGDAAFGVPFFKSLNNGLQAGTSLSQKIVASLHEDPQLKDRMLTSFSVGAAETPFASYSLYMKAFCRTEILWARVKSFVLDLLLFFVKISARVPWQTNYWTEAQLQQIRAH